MARTSNRYNALEEKKEQEIRKVAGSYKTALYARISVEVADNPTETIENQISVMKRYLKDKPELAVVKEYIDRNYSGTNFHRPAFEEMMDDVRKGTINCILVKDMSRLGRDFLETSNYIEIIFPFLNVRFISVNDHYDTEKEHSGNKGLEISMKNLVNDLYARDISTRISLVKREHFKQGKFSSCQAPYGYKVDSSDPNRRFLIDPKPAAVVRDIFEMVLKGMKHREISKELQKRKLATPGEYYRTGEFVSSSKEIKTKWYIGTISNILHNQAYIGDLVQGKKRQRLCNGEKLRKMPKEEWVVVEHAHEPIISKEVYDEVQEILDEKTKESVFYVPDGMASPMKPDKYKGLIFCGICRKKLNYFRYNKKYETYGYHCEDTYDINKKEKCKVQISERIMDEIIKEHLINILNKYNHSTGNLENIINEKTMRELKPARTEREKLCRKLDAYEYENRENYESYVMGEKTKEEFLTDQDHYKKKQQDIRMKVILIDRKMEDYQNKAESEKNWLCSLDQFKNHMELNETLLHSLIKRINVYPKYEVEIQYRFREEDIEDE